VSGMRAPQLSACANRAHSHLPPDPALGSQGYTTENIEGGPRDDE
jgi:hypothetical protein